MTKITNIAQIFVDVAKENGPRDAIVEAKTGRTLTFFELDKRSDNYCHYFNKKGIRPGEIVMLMVTPSIEFICLTLSLFKIGTPIVLIDPGMGFKNLLKCIERVQPRHLVGIPKAILFSRLFSKPFAYLKNRFCCGNSFGFLGENINKTASDNCEPYEVFSAGPEDLAAIIFTTGSTGPPKGVRYEHSIFRAQLDLIRQYYGIGPEDVDQPAFPLFALFSAALGACSVIPDMDATKPAKVNPEKFVNSIKKYNVTYSFGSPAIWNVVSQYCEQQDIKFTSLKKILMAGAPVPYELMSRMRLCLQEDAQIHTPYGATESLPIVSIESAEVLGETFAKSRAGKGTCVGRPLPGVKIMIIELSDDVIPEIGQARRLQANEIGEIIVCGDVVTRAYMNNDEETNLSKIADNDGFWHRMGDVGYLDDKGRLWFCGRKAHRVVTKKKTYFPIPSEAIFNEHDSVYRSALVKITNEKDEVEPAIVLETVKEKPVADNFLDEIRQLAGQSSLTKDIDHFLIHPDFPVDIRHNAKIFREKLSQWAQTKIYPNT